MAHFSLDISGQRFGKLVAVKKTEKRKGNACVWLCECDCGTFREFSTSDLRSEHSKSCGCAWRTRGSDAPTWKGCGEISGAFWTHLAKGARRRSIEFDLTVEGVWQKFLEQEGRCALTGEKLFFSSSSTSWDGTASLDRIDSSKGYFLGNVQWVDKAVNKAKQDLSDEEFVELCCRVVKYNRKDYEF
jgi:hypothetical protein